MRRVAITGRRRRPKAPPNIADQPEAMAVRPREAQRLLDISPSTFWKLVRLKRLRTLKVSENTTRVEMAEIRRFLAEHAANAAD
jgi:hypothetical protein